MGGNVFLVHLPLLKPIEGGPMRSVSNANVVTISPPSLMPEKRTRSCLASLAQRKWTLICPQVPPSIASTNGSRTRTDPRLRQMP